MVIIVGVLAALGFGIVVTALLSWPTMLLFGAVHSFLPVIPAFGFWQTFVIMLLIRFLLPTPSVSSN